MADDTYDFVLNQNIDIDTVFGIFHTFDPSLLARIQKLCDKNMNDANIRQCIVNSMKVIRDNILKQTIEQSVFEKGDKFKQARIIRQQQQRRRQDQNEENQERLGRPPRNQTLFDKDKYQQQVQALERELNYLKNYYTQTYTRIQRDLADENARLKLQLDRANGNGVDDGNREILERNRVMIEQLTRELEICHENRNNAHRTITVMTKHMKDLLQNEKSDEPNIVFDSFLKKYRRLLELTQSCQTQLTRLPNRMRTSILQLNTSVNRVGKGRALSQSARQRITKLEKANSQFVARLETCLNENKQLDRYRKQYEELNEKLTFQDNLIISLRTELAQLNKENQNSSTNVSKHIDKNRKLLNIRKKLENKIKDLEMKLKKCTDESVDLSNHMKTLETRIQEQNETILQNQDEIQKCVESIVELATSLSVDGVLPSNTQQTIDAIKTTYILYRRLEENIAKAVEYYTNLRKSLSHDKENEAQVYSFVLDILANVQTNQPFVEYKDELVLDLDAELKLLSNAVRSNISDENSQSQSVSDYIPVDLHGVNPTQFGVDLSNNPYTYSTTPPNQIASQHYSYNDDDDNTQQQQQLVDAQQNNTTVYDIIDIQDDSQLSIGSKRSRSNSFHKNTKVMRLPSINSNNNTTDDDDNVVSRSSTPDDFQQQQPETSTPNDVPSYSFRQGTLKAIKNLLQSETYSPPPPPPYPNSGNIEGPVYLSDDIPMATNEYLQDNDFVPIQYDNDAKEYDNAYQDPSNNDDN